MYKAKKGDAIVIRKERFMTDAKMKTTRYDEWYFGRAFKVNRMGIVERFCFGKDDVPWTIDRSVQIFTISEKDRRAAADKLCKKLGSKPFRDVEDIKNLIIQAGEASNGKVA